MESVVGKNGPVHDLPQAGHGPQGHTSKVDEKRSVTEADAMAACLELCGFLQGGLVSAQDALGQSVSLQKAMMDVVSRHILVLGRSEQPGVAPEDMAELVTALQTDDLMRQRHENLARAMAAMAQIVKEVGALTETFVGTQTSAEELGRCWREDLLEMLTLDEMRQGFERGLEMADSD